MRISTVLFGVVVALLLPSSVAAVEPAHVMLIAGRTSMPIGHYEFCQFHKVECNISSKAEVRVKLTATKMDELDLVNDQVNTAIAPATDMELYGVEEFWTYPTTQGDCEDYVLLKRRDLIEAGWPVAALLITVVRQTNGDGHAVLTVLTDHGDLVLDNLEPDVHTWDKTSYEYVKRQSRFNTGDWEAIVDLHMPPQATAVAKK